MLKRTDENHTVDSSEEPVDRTSSDRNSGRLRTVLSLVIRGGLQIFLMIAVLAGSFVFMNMIIDSKPEKRKRPKFRTVYTINTVPVELGDHRPIFTVYGETVASRTVDLRSLVSGEVTAISTKLKVGTHVSKGDALVEIDDFNFTGALREAKANRDEVLARIKENQSRIGLEKSKLQHLNNQLELTRADHKRIAALRENGTTTQKQLDDRSMALSQRTQASEQSQITLQTENAKLEQQKAGLERLNWRLQLAERNLQNTVLKAPFDGVVRTTGVEVGKIVSANDVVVSLYEDANIDVKFTLTDQRYGRLQADNPGILGREIDINWAIGGKKYVYPATIDRVGAEISSNRGGVEVFATLQHVKGNPAIRPGAFVEMQVPDVLFTNSTKVPETAIYNGDRVYIKIGEKLESRTVNVLAYNRGSVILSGSLKNGDKILTTRIAEISNGLRVREQTEKPAPSVSGD